MANGDDSDTTYQGGGGSPDQTSGTTADLDTGQEVRRAQPVPSAQSTPTPSPTPESSESYNDMGKAVVQSYLRAERHQEEVNQKMAPLYEALQKQLEQPLPQMPQMEQIPQPPSQQALNQRLNQGRFQYLAVALPLAFLLGRHGRNASWAAMGAFGTGLSALSKNDQEGAANMFKTWQESAAYVKEENAQKMEMYKNVLENRKLNLDQQMSLIDVISKQLNDPVIQQKAEAKDILGIIGQLTKNEKAVAEFEKVQRDLTQGHLEKWGSTKEGAAYTAEIQKRDPKLDPFESKESWEKANKIENYKDFLTKFYKEEKGTASEDTESKEETPESSVQHVNNADDYNKLPSGATFIDPDGVTRVKP